MKLTDKKKISTLIWLCAVAYFVSYISRINLSAVMVEVYKSGFTSKGAVALAITICSVTYGAGQIISGFLGDKYKPQNIMFAGFMLTAAMNLCVFFLKSGTPLLVIWGVNGFAQALMWPPIVAIMTKFLTLEDYTKGCVRVGWGSSIGTIAVYALAPVIISLWGFKYVFMVSGIAALLMGFSLKIFYKKYYETEEDNCQVEEKIINSAPTCKFDKTAILIMGIICLFIILQGSIRDGIANWMPSYISETFNLSSSISILTGVILPIFTILCVQVASFVYRKVIKNELNCSGAFFALCAVVLVLLALVTGKSVGGSVLLFAVASGCIHGTNMMFTCIIPRCYEKYGHISLISGILNSCTYIGAAVSTYGIALFSDAYGWTGTALLWAVIASLGALGCFAIAKSWNKIKS